MDERYQLDARLIAIDRMIPHVHNCADIGADHGYLGAHLLMSGKCDMVQFLDISADSLKKAWRTCRRYDLLDRATFSVGDGAEALVQRPDVAVIAGMGGQTIAGIVERGREKMYGAMLIMQPNVGAPELRERLMRTGYEIVNEDIARAGNRWYVVIAARPGQAQYTQEQLLIGPELIARKHPNLPGYAAFRLRVAKKALAGAEKSDNAVARAFRLEIERWEAVALECDDRADD